MDENVAEASETTDFLPQDSRLGAALAPEPGEDLFVRFGGPAEGAREQVRTDIENDFAAEVQAPLGEPLRVFVLAELRERCFSLRRRRIAF